MNRTSDHRTFAARMLALCCLLALLAGPAAAREPGVYVHSEAVVEGAEVHLGDIAAITGLGDASREVSGLYVGKSPSPGRQKSLRGAWIEAKLGQMNLPQGLNLEIPPRIRVERASQTLEEDQLQTILEDFLSSRLTAGSFQVARFQVNGNGPVPEGALDLVIQDPGEGKCYGQVNLRASISVDGETARRLSMAAWVDYETPVVVAARTLERNAVLSQADVTVQRMNVSRMAEGILSDPAGAVGMRIRQGMPEGKPFLARMLEKPPLVEKGDDVTIVAQSGGLVITAKGLAQDPGGLGDRINVENVMSEKTVACRVTGRGMVEVYF